MVLITLTSILLESTFFIIKKTYQGVVYLAYGHQETTDEKILKRLELIEKENAILIERISLST